MSLSRLIPLLIVMALLSFTVGCCSPVLFGEEGETARILKSPHKEIERVKSPDGLVDAILVEVETDPLSANGFIICLAPSGTDLENLTRSYEPNIFYANRLQHLKLVWREPKFLEIRYNRAAVLRFRNYHWMTGIGGQESYKVELRLMPEGEHSLPF
jgi:hypothetical protein